MVNYWDKYTEMHGQQNVNTLHVSDGLSVHHQKSMTVNTALGICRAGSVAASKQPQILCAVFTVLDFWWSTERPSETCRVFLSQYLTNLVHKSLFYNKFYFWYHHTYRCDDTRSCVMQFWPPDDEHMCSKHVEAWNKTYCETQFCASSWLNTEINILRCAVNRTSKCRVLFPE